MTAEITGFQSWAYVELMGHNKIAGFVTELKLGNNSMIRVDVPQCDDLPAFTKIYNVSAIYGITPIDEEGARDFVKNMRVKPFDVWEMQKIFDEKIKDMVSQGRLLKPEISKPESVSSFDPLADVEFPHYE